MLHFCVMSGLLVWSKENFARIWHEKLHEDNMVNEDAIAIYRNRDRIVILLQKRNIEWLYGLWRRDLRNKDKFC